MFRLFSSSLFYLLTVLLAFGASGQEVQSHMSEDRGFESRGSERRLEGPSIIAGWPDLIVCRAGRAYEILYNRVRGNGQNVAYSNGTTFVRFEGRSRRIHKVTAQTRAVQQSQCTMGASLYDIERYNLPQGRRSLIAGWPDAIVCEAGNNKYEILYNRIRGARGFVAYENPGAFVRFNHNTRRVETVRGQTAALRESNCFVGNRLSRIRSFNIDKESSRRSPNSTVGGYPDMMVCRSDQGKYEILYHWIRGLRGHTAYSNPGAFVRFEKRSGQIHKVKGETRALKESACYNRSLHINDVEAYNFYF